MVSHLSDNILGNLWFVGHSFGNYKTNPEINLVNQNDDDDDDDESISN